MTDDGSITQLAQQLRAEDPNLRNEAAQQIWQRYFPRLLHLAAARLDPGIRAREDEEDVLQSMYHSFCSRQMRGDFQLANRDELWLVLVVITQRKIQNVVKHHRRQRRDYRRTQQQPDQPVSDDVWRESLEQMEMTDPTPEEVAILSEELQQRLAMLPEALRQVALWKLQGFTNEEIAGAAMLDCAPRTVERKLALIRKAWLEAAEE